MTSKMIKMVNYKGDPYCVHLTKYVNGDNAIILHTNEELYPDQQQIVMSVSLEGLEGGEAAIRDNDFYNGNFDFLVNENIIKPTNKYIQSGYVNFPVGEIIC